MEGAEAEVWRGGGRTWQAAQDQALLFGFSSLLEVTWESGFTFNLSLRLSVSFLFSSVFQSFLFAQHHHLSASDLFFFLSFSLSPFSVFDSTFKGGIQQNPDFDYQIVK